MRLASVAFIASAALFSFSAASADAAELPMGQFLNAFYQCDQGRAFQASYDSKNPHEATVTTSDNNKQYQLKRVSGGKTAQFSNGTVTIWLDGKAATVQGTTAQLTGCKLKSTS